MELETANATTSATATPPAAEMWFEFLSLPGEIRNRICRLVLCHDKTIDFYTRPNLHAQLLYTCRQIYIEAMPILYGENTFEIRITNWRSVDACLYRLYYPGALTPILKTPYGLFLNQVDEEDEGIQERERRLDQWRQDRARRCSLLRRFHVVICYEEDVSFSDIWESITEINSLLLHKREGTTSETDRDDDTGSAAAPTTTIDYLSLDYEGMSIYIDEVEGPNGTQKQLELFDMIVARLGEASGFRGVVKEVGPITGLPEETAKTLRQTWQQQRRPKRLLEVDDPDCEYETTLKRQRQASEQEYDA